MVFIVFFHFCAHSLEMCWHESLTPFSVQVKFFTITAAPYDRAPTNPEGIFAFEKVLLSSSRFCSHFVAQCKFSVAVGTEYLWCCSGVLLAMKCEV